MALTIDELREKFPELILTQDSILEMAIEESVFIMGTDEDRWLDVYSIARMYLCAHLATIAEGTATGDSSVNAPIGKTEVDDVVVDYAVKAVDISDPAFEEFNTTAYGKRYIMYRRMCFTGWWIA